MWRQVRLLMRVVPDALTVFTALALTLATVTVAVGYYSMAWRPITPTDAFGAGFNRLGSNEYLSNFTFLVVQNLAVFVLIAIVRWRYGNERFVGHVRDALQDLIQKAVSATDAAMKF